MALPNEITKFQDCLSSEVNSIEFVMGTLIFCRDTGECYYDGFDGVRVPISQYVYIFNTDAERESYTYYDANVIYIVRETGRIYIYNGGWICLNSGASDTYYFDIEHVIVPVGESVVVNDTRIDAQTCTGSYVPIPSLYDLFGSATVVCGNGQATITLADTQYEMIGTLKISSNKTATTTDEETVG